MSKISEYIKLTKKLRAARRAMLDAQAKITVYHATYALDKSDDAEIAACINKCEKVCDKDLNICDDGGYVKNCALFDELPCPDRKCPWFSRNLDYTVAKERYEVARDARREFLRNIRKARTK